MTAMSECIIGCIRMDGFLYFFILSIPLFFYSLYSISFFLSYSTSLNLPFSTLSSLQPYPLSCHQNRSTSYNSLLSGEAVCAVISSRATRVIRRSVCLCITRHLPRRRTDPYASRPHRRTSPICSFTSVYSLWHPSTGDEGILRLARARARVCCCCWWCSRCTAMTGTAMLRVCIVRSETALGTLLYVLDPPSRASRSRSEYSDACERRDRIRRWEWE
jgi:hypothetical protein